MPKVTPAHERQRRQQILDAATACFARQGYRATSMEDIVRESGLSVGAIYTYFPSKEDLFLALADQRMEQTVAYLTELFSRPGPMAGKVGEAVDYFFHLLDTELVAYARTTFEFWSEARRLGRLQQRHAERSCRIREFFVRLFRDAQARGEIRPGIDLETAAELMMALNDGLLLHHVSGVQTVPLDRLKSTYVSFVNSGLAGAGHPFLAARDGSNGAPASARDEPAETPAAGPTSRRRPIPAGAN